MFYRFFDLLLSLMKDYHLNNLTVKTIFLISIVPQFFYTCIIILILLLLFVNLLYYFPIFNCCCSVNETPDDTDEKVTTTYRCANCFQYYFMVNTFHFCELDVTYQLSLTYLSSHV